MSAQPQAGQPAHLEPEMAGTTDLIENASPEETPKFTKQWNTLDTADFWQLSTFDKLGAVFQVSTVVLCILLCPTGLVDSFRSDFTNCDDKAPFPQAVLSAILALCLCCLAGGLSSAIGTARIKITESNGLKPDARERRRLRAPRYLLAAVVPTQFLAALMLGQTAYRTAQADLYWSPVPVLAIVASFACIASGLWNAILAFLVYRTTWSPVDLKVSEEKSNDETAEEPSNDQNWLFDTTLQSFLSLPTLDRTAILANPLALASGLTLILTTSAFLWTEPCGTKERKALMEASETATQVVCATLSMHMTIVPVLLLRAGHPFKGEKPKRWAVGFPAVFFCVHGGLLVALAYMMRTSTYGLQLVRAQECVAAVMYFLCGVCNFKLMLNTNFNEPLPEEETVEADAGTRNE